MGRNQKAYLCNRLIGVLTKDQQKKYLVGLGKKFTLKKHLIGVSHVERKKMSESTTLLECPKCSHISKVYHLDWYAVVCEGCSEEVKLTEFKETEEES